MDRFLVNNLDKATKLNGDNRNEQGTSGVPCVELGDDSKSDESSNTDDEIVGEKSKKRKRTYKPRKYRREWESHPDLKSKLKIFFLTLHFVVFFCFMAGCVLQIDL